MDFPEGLIEGRFKARLNRFLAIVEVQGREVGVHVANSGRMREMLVPGYRVLIAPKPRDHRKTNYDLALVDMGDALASADARLPNALVAEAFAQERLPQFGDYSDMQAEVVFGESRLDLRLQGAAGLCYVEAKSVTLVVDGVGLFPDAPTTRGAKHVRSLAQAVKAGHRAAVIFVIQRDDARGLRPHDEADPDFGATLRESVAAGVEAYAYNCQVTETGITLDHQLPVLL